LLQGRASETSALFIKTEVDSEKNVNDGQFIKEILGGRGGQRMKCKGGGKREPAPCERSEGEKGGVPGKWDGVKRGTKSLPRAICL